jgi:transcriptional regulator with XRE-family HTH domain
MEAVVITPESIKELRLRHGWSQRDLAEVLNVTASTIGRWERGISEPAEDAADALRQMLGRAPDRTKTIAIGVGAAAAGLALGKAVYDFFSRRSA